VLNVVHGDRVAVDALLAHPGVAAISFVGSAPVAAYIYREAAARGKRVQALGGAKNHLVVMPDADFGSAVPAICGSAFGNAGERCLAGSVVVAVGEASRRLLDPLAEQAGRLRVGPGTEPGVDVGPLIRREHRDRVAGYVAKGEAEGATVLVDGRGEMSRPGFFLGPTLLDGVAPDMSVGRDEIFGPVLSVSHAATLDDAIAQANQMALGNMAVIFTGSGRSAREFRERVEAGMVGVNVPVAQPFAFYPFSGWKGSFLGDLHVHGTDGVDFYTRKKMFISRW
jgi:malonate-semialdehyde dehydrogenase (acetylating) / methylmalonate-semialdehyde dehydrogenase